MEQVKTHNSEEETILAQTIWTTLTPAQQEMVFQTIVQICCQMVAQREKEVSHEPSSE